MYANSCGNDFFLTVKSIKQKKTHMDFSYLHRVQNRKDRQVGRCRAVNSANVNVMNVLCLWLDFFSQKLYMNKILPLLYIL